MSKFYSEFYFSMHLNYVINLLSAGAISTSAEFLYYIKVGCEGFKQFKNIAMFYVLSRNKKNITVFHKKLSFVQR